MNLSELIPPLTAVDSNLQDFPFMPLDVVRLRDSDLSSKTTGDQFRCAVLLWCVSWHQTPAGSLPNDDVSLAQYAGFGRVVKEWLKVRKGALHGWVLCADGRLYHPVIAEKVNEAWAGRLAYRDRKEADRARKAEERRLRKLAEDSAAGILNPQDAAALSTGQPEHVKRTFFENPVENALRGTVDSGQWTVDSKPTTTSDLAVGGVLTALHKQRQKNFHSTDEDTKAANWMFGLVLVVNAAAKRPNMDAWGNEIRLMRELDGRTHKEICELFQWAKRDAFWSPNIQSPRKLREKWDELVERRARPARVASSNWWENEISIKAKAAEFGIKARPGDSTGTLKWRIEAAIANGGVEPAPPRGPSLVVREQGKRSVKPAGMAPLASLVKIRGDPP